MAVSDESETLVWPHDTHRREGAGSTQGAQHKASRRDVAAVVGAVRGLGAQGLVFGLPRALDGKAGAGEEAVRSFASQVQNALGEAGLNLEIEWWDERFSTREALGQMRDLGISQKRGRQSDGASSTDARAAAVILQGFLDGKSAARQRALDFAENKNAVDDIAVDDNTVDESATEEATGSDTRAAQVATDGSFGGDGSLRNGAREAILINPKAASDEADQMVVNRDAADQMAREDAGPKDLF